MNLEHPKTFFKQALLSLSLLGFAAQASAQVTVDDAWVRATVPGQASTGAFMKLTASEDSKLVEVQSPVAKTVQIHQSSMKDDVMRMQQVDAVLLPAGQPIVLDPNSFHVMLIDLVGQVKEGDKVPLTLVVKDANGVKQMIAVEATAAALNAPAHGEMHDHSKMH